MEKLTRDEAKTLFTLLVVIEQDLEYNGLNGRWQNTYVTDFVLNQELYYGATNLFEKTKKASWEDGLIIIDDDGAEMGNIGGPGYNIISLLTILLKDIILAIHEVASFKGDLFYDGRLEISNLLLGDAAALKSQLRAIIFD